MGIAAETMNYVALFFLVTTVLGIFYLVIATAATLAFARRPLDPVPAWLPSISVLKPVCGLEAGLYDALESFCMQEYAGTYEVIFCLHDAADSALPIVERVIAAHPECDARIATGDDPTHRNPKIANISNAAATAGGEIVVVADSDIHVDPQYLRSLAASFTSERTGAVTCLYRADPGRGIIAQLGAAYVEDQFAPSVLVTLAFGTLRFCLGATMAVRRSVLDAIGGIGALGPFLADDHKLGELVTAHGFDVVLSRYIVATSIGEATLRQLASHELRWARTNLVLAPVGFTFSFVMYALPLALLYLLASTNVATGGTLLAIALAVRLGLHYSARAALGVKRPDAAWLIPIRDVLSTGIWAASLFGRTVRWRGVRISVQPNGELLP